MAISTIGVTLNYKTTVGGTYAKLVDIKDFPDIGGAPELLETTTLSDPAQTFIKGVKQQQGMEFTANYTDADYDTVAALVGSTIYYQLAFGAAGADGTFEWQGEHDLYVVGNGVNAVQDMKIVVIPSTEIVKT